MPYNAIKIANTLIDVDREQGGYGLTPMQLIKLAYIAHGWSFVFNDEPLLNEAIQAWQYGPVVPSLYRAASPYKSSRICGYLPGDNDPNPVTARDRELISAVYDRYKHLDGIQLSALTHMDNTPWSRVWNDNGQNSRIPDELIAQHYHQRYREMMPQ